MLLTTRRDAYPASAQRHLLGVDSRSGLTTTKPSCSIMLRSEIRYTASDLSRIGTGLAGVTLRQRTRVKKTNGVLNLAHRASTVQFRTCCLLSLPTVFAPPRQPYRAQVGSRKAPRRCCAQTVPRQYSLSVQPTDRAPRRLPVLASSGVHLFYKADSRQSPGPRAVVPGELVDPLIEFALQRVHVFHSGTLLMFA